MDIKIFKSKYECVNINIYIFQRKYIYIYMCIKMLFVKITFHMRIQFYDSMFHIQITRERRFCLLVAKFSQRWFQIEDLSSWNY